MKKNRILSAVLVMLLAVACALPSSAATVDQFTDVHEKDWFYKAVDYVTQKGLFSGISDTEFGPDIPMTRGMFVTVLGRKSNVDVTLYQEGRFSDVLPDKYYAPFVNWAAKNGIVEGTGNETFSPDTPITRQQTAKILFSYAQKTGNDTTLSSIYFGYHADSATVSAYALDAMKWATTHRIINGNQGYLYPHNSSNRGEIAQMLMNAKWILVGTEITDTPHFTDTTYTVTDTNGTPVLSFPLPDAWGERVLIRDGHIKNKSGISFYSAQNQNPETGYGGFLFQIYTYENSKDYEQIPNLRFISKIEVNDTIYDIVWRQPTDVQFYPEYQEEYQQMQADIPRMIAGITFHVPTL